MQAYESTVTMVVLFMFYVNNYDGLCTKITYASLTLRCRSIEQKKN